MESSTRAIIHLAAFRNNLQTVRGAIGPAVKIMAVLKSNAYGHGVKAIAREAVRCGIDYLAVARLAEGLELRREGIETPILVCEIIPEDQIDHAIHEGLDLTVSSWEGAQAIESVAGKRRRKARIHVKVDTGMARLGFPHDSAVDSIGKIAGLKSIELHGVFSHFATSEESDQTFAREQLNRFTSLLERLDRQRIEIPLRHMSNSGAILTLPESHFDMVRPGIMLYGYAPLHGLPGSEQLRPVLSLVSRVSFVKDVDANTSISYGRKYYTSSKTRIATVPIGYGDGYSRMLTGKTVVLIRGEKHPVVGTICMDHLMVDVGVNSEVAPGDEVTLIGNDGGNEITCWDIAGALGTIPYEVTCLITPRVPRVVVG